MAGEDMASQLSQFTETERTKMVFVRVNAGFDGPAEFHSEDLLLNCWHKPVHVSCIRGISQIAAGVGDGSRGVVLGE